MNKNIEENSSFMEEHIKKLKCRDCIYFDSALYIRVANCMHELWSGKYTGKKLSIQEKRNLIKNIIDVHGYINGIINECAKYERIAKSTERDYDA